PTTAPRSIWPLASRRTSRNSKACHRMSPRPDRYHKDSMRRWWIAGVLVGATLLAETPTSTVRELMQTVRAALAANESDGSIAKTIHKFRLSERLEDEAIEALEAEGAGPKTAASLTALRDESERLDAPGQPLPIDHPPQPSSDEIKQLVADLRSSAG